MISWKRKASRSYTTTVLGLAQDSVGYVDNEFFQTNVPEEVRTAMEEAKTKIASGELEVKSYYDFADDNEFNEYVQNAG